MAQVKTISNIRFGNEMHHELHQETSFMLLFLI